ncbi:MFS transporter [Sinorhizobium mexicanum]|uniref:MFS transporter n=1 Tax=Sinorhizobium mexicanum TaxID=375549 RepID=A0A859QZY4_9HYPH|nr:MFS transporter [Sinorhizobium mexicanum]MBP1883776.1 MFS family permease [Sinorhizobium mexicanum]QLL62948.1 MFS transporter [Sinorhizobium mexicanum]
MSPDHSSEGVDGRQASPRSFLYVFPKVALPMFLALSDQSIVAAALPAIAGSIGSVEQVSLVVIGYLIAATIAAPVYGRLGDLFGRRILLLCALTIFMSSSIICLLSQNLAMLVAGRVLQGLGGGGLMALSQALIGETVEPRERARYQGYLASVGVTSNALGPVLGGILTENFGWRSVFLFSVPVSLLAFWLISRLPKRSANNRAMKFDYYGLLLFACFVVSMLLLLDRVQSFEPSEIPAILALLAVAMVSISLLVAVEHRVAAPLLPVDLFRHPAIWRANAVAACHGGILVSLLTFVPIQLRVVHGASAAEIGLLIAPMTVGIGIGSLITGQIVSRTGRTAILPSWGLVFATTGLVLIAFFVSDFGPLQLSTSLGLMALFMGTVMSVVQVTVQSAAGQAKIGAGAASVQYSRSMGAALGTAFTAAVLFSMLSGTDPEAGRLFGHVLQDGMAALHDLPAERAKAIQAEFAQSFRAAFLAIAGMAAVAAVLNWTMPLRRI